MSWREDPAQRVVAYLADEFDGGAQRGQAGRGVGRRPAGRLRGWAEGGVDPLGVGVVDQGHGALLQAEAGYEGSRRTGPARLRWRDLRRQLQAEDSWMATVVRVRLGSEPGTPGRRDVAVTESFRLPANVRPRRYQLELRPDLERSRFEGTVTVSFDVLAATTQLVLNAADLDLSDAASRGAGPQLAARRDLLERGPSSRPPSTSPRRWRPATDYALHLRFGGIPQRPAAGVLSQHVSRRRGPRAGYRNHPVRADRRPPGLSVLGRTGFQGDVRSEPGRRRRPDGVVQWPRSHPTTIWATAAGASPSKRP